MHWLYPAIVLLLATHPALAQVSMTAADGFNAGLLYPWLPAQQTMALVAVGILVGRYFCNVLGRISIIFVVAVACGFAVPPSALPLATISLCLLSLSLTAAALVALDTPAPQGLAWAVAAAAGLLDGIASAPDRGQWDVMAGVMAGGLVRAAALFFVALIVTDWLANGKQWLWARIGIRVLSAWIIAIGILMIALQFVQP